MENYIILLVIYAAILIFSYKVLKPYFKKQ